MSEVTIVDGICSIARAVPLEILSDLHTGRDIPAREGTLVVGRVLSDKDRYNMLELSTGQAVRLTKGRSYVLVLGNRSALDGYVGEVPSAVHPGDTLQILNLGGICGACRSYNHTIVGRPFDIEIVGSVLNEQGKPVNISDHAPVHGAHSLSSTQPLIMVYGTCMNVGKTQVACTVISALAQRGKKVAGAKLTGAGCLKDTLAMRESGAVATLDLVDAGFTSTVTKKHTVAGAKGIINVLSEMDLEVMVVEIGDGVISEYHGKNILLDRELHAATVMGIGCAHDLTGAWGLKMLARRHNFRLDMFSGRVTDTTSGSGYIQKKWGLSAINVLTDQELFRSAVCSFLDAQEACRIAAIDVRQVT